MLRNILTTLNKAYLARMPLVLSRFNVSLNKQQLAVQEVTRYTILCPSNSGMVTVEAAIVLLVMTVFCSFGCALILLCISYIHAVDIAHEAARLAARGERMNRDSYNQVAVHINQEGNIIRTEVDVLVPLLHTHIYARNYAVSENDAVSP